MLSSTANNTVSTAQKRIAGRKTFIELRHEIIRSRFNELKSFRHQGISLDYDQVIEKLHQEYGFAKRTIQDIIKGR